MTRSALDTPMMRQYLAIKERHPEAIVFYRMGDFYEMFLRDAEVAAPLLDIALTTRDRGKRDAVPMCGVPVHGADQYVRRLAELGHRVAICEQVEDPRRLGGRRLVRRDVVEVVTPGLLGDPDGALAGTELALAAIDPGDGSGDGGVGLAVLDATTGDFRATSTPRGEDGEALPPGLREELVRVAPREILLPAEGAGVLEAALARALPDTPCTRVAAERYRPDRAPAHPAGLSPEARDPAARAAAAALAYVGANQPFALPQISRLRRYELRDSMVLDASTRGHLELFENAEDRGRRGTLLERIDLAVTPPGSRRLSRWLAYPLLDPAAVAGRQDAVAFLAERDRPRARLREALSPVRDLERRLSRVARPTATPRDLAALRASLQALPGVVAALAAPDEERLPGDGGFEEAPPALPRPEPVPGLAKLLEEALVDDPPAVARGSRGAGDSGYVRDGFRSELDGLREAVRKGREWIAGLEARERERTGIGNLRVRFHPVHGYSLEVTRARAARVPGDYERKQTLAGSERFTTPELREVEQSVLGARERAAALEREILESLRQSALASAPAVRAAADAVASLDAAAALAEGARRSGWVRPVVDDGPALEIEGGRHPVIEPLLLARGEEFVPNDTRLTAAEGEPGPDEARILLVTGPNMSGKSTYLRQVAQIVLLAQMGSFVPAERARVGVVDRVFTRVGASDRLARGESTFMVEMNETAEILSQASTRSLVILDEIGRGTSTWDGLSIAWAVAEYLHDTPGLRCRTLFATHYHELTDLARTRPGLRNAHFEVREWGEEVIFLRRLVSGGASRSYGIQVARLAGLPEAVIARARGILEGLEGSADAASAAGVPAGAGAGGPGARDAQLGLFAPPAARPEEREVLDALHALEPEAMTPLDALQRLDAWVRRLRGGGA